MASAPSSEFARRVAAIAQITSEWADYWLATVMCQVGAEWPEGELLVGLQGNDGRYMPSWLHLARIRYLRMDDAHEIDALWVDEVRVSWLPAKRSSWPVKACLHQLRSWLPEESGRADLECEMAMVEIIGPWSMEAIAQIIDVSVRPPELENVADSL